MNCDPNAIKLWLDGIERILAGIGTFIVFFTLALAFFGNPYRRGPSG